MAGKRGLIMGVANNRSIAWGIARACRDHEHVATGYVDLHGNTTQRRLEPYQLVTTGRRWYLLCFDRDRQDWRTLRLDRMADVRALGSTFIPRQAPDAAAYVRRSISASPYRFTARVRYHAPQDALAKVFSQTAVDIAESCKLLLQVAPDFATFGERFLLTQRRWVRPAGARC